MICCRSESSNMANGSALPGTFLEAMRYEYKITIVDPVCLNLM